MSDLDSMNFGDDKYHRIGEKAQEYGISMRDLNYFIETGNRPVPKRYPVNIKPPRKEVKEYD